VPVALGVLLFVGVGNTGNPLEGLIGNPEIGLIGKPVRKSILSARRVCKSKYRPLRGSLRKPVIGSKIAVRGARMGLSKSLRGSRIDPPDALGRAGMLGVRRGPSIPLRGSRIGPRIDPPDALGRAGMLGVRRGPSIPLRGSRIGSRIDPPDAPGRRGVLCVTDAPERLGRLSEPDGKVGSPVGN
jgi:hypothetical protein